MKAFENFTAVWSGPQVIGRPFQLLTTFFPIHNPQRNLAIVLFKGPVDLIYILLPIYRIMNNSIWGLKIYIVIPGFPLLADALLRGTSVSVFYVPGIWRQGTIATQIPQFLRLWSNLKIVLFRWVCCGASLCCGEPAGKLSNSFALSRKLHVGPAQCGRTFGALWSHRDNRLRSSG